MNESQDKKAVSKEKEELQKLIVDAAQASCEYGFYYIVVNEILPRMFRSQAFKKIEDLKIRHQNQRVGIKNDVEYQLLIGYESLKEDLKNIADSQTQQHIRLIDMQVQRCANTRVGWEFVYDKIKDLLKYLLSFRDKNHIVFKYSKIEQKTSSIDLVIDDLLFISSWKKMQEIDCMFTSNIITDVSVAAILLDGFLKCWDVEKNVFDLDIDADLQLFLVSMQQDHVEFVILKKERSKYEPIILFFTKAKILSCLNLVIDKMFEEELVYDIDVIKNDRFKVIVGKNSGKPCLLLEVSSIKQGIAVVYVIKYFRGGANSQIYKLTDDIFSCESGVVINIIDACKSNELKEITWSEYFSKIGFQSIQNIVFEKHSKINCMVLLNIEFSGKDLSSIQRKKIALLLLKLPKAID